MGADTRKLTTSERTWMDTRAYLRAHRSALDAAAAQSYPSVSTVAGTPLLTRPEWIPQRLLRLEDLDLELIPARRNEGVADGLKTGGLPIRATGEPYASYAEAVGEIAAPAVFEDRPTYRLLGADLAGSQPTLRFGLGSYFDSINVGEAAAHEFALTHRGHALTGGVRAAISDPCDPGQRPVNVAISTLTIRREPATGEQSFLLHWRDPRKVGHAGGMYQVVPVGIFQPSGYAYWNVGNDFSLWHNMIRELAEELCGEDEDHGSEGAPIDYAAWPFASRLDAARRDRSVEVFCLGLGVDPLSFATDLLTAVIIDSPVFDELFGDVVSTNAEGRVLELQPFSAQRVQQIIDNHPVQAAGNAALRLAITLFD
ncbi:hypothetical protein [Nocardia brasiliensis]|uniref:hypothetical protein n=1 Tax=Nocardia brasiliensis TaxID=37326 RepID=UPI0024567C31|nr:hypothetical protein [Nocardia brasiliensis]